MVIFISSAIFVFSCFFCDSAFFWRILVFNSCLTFSSSILFRELNSGEVLLRLELKSEIPSLYKVSVNLEILNLPSLAMLDFPFPKFIVLSYDVRFVRSLVKNKLFFLKVKGFV